MTSCLMTTTTVKAMVKAMKAHGDFTVTTDYDDAGTVAAVHTPTGERVFDAIQKGDKGNPWIVRYRADLFSENPA